MAAPAQCAPFGHTEVNVGSLHARAERTMHSIACPCCALHSSFTRARNTFRCTSSPMGGKRHKGIGMNRAKKKKVLAGAVVVSSAPVNEEAEEDEDEDAAPNPSPPDPPPPPPPAQLVEAASAQVASAADSLYEHLERAKEAEAAARRHCAMKLRRWQKAKTTYIDSGNYSRYDEPSIVNRVEERLWKADVELATARARVAQCRISFVRLRTLLALYEKLCESDPADPVLRRFWDRARVRVLEPVPMPNLRDMWPGQRSNIWEYNQESFGLAPTWGLTHLDNL